MEELVGLMPDGWQSIIILALGVSTGVKVIATNVESYLDKKGKGSGFLRGLVKALSYVTTKKP